MTHIDNLTVSKLRLIAGGSLFIVGLLAPLLIPVVVASDLNVEITAMISGLLMLGVPEIFMLAAVATLGKSGYSYLKTKLFLMLKKAAPADTVSLLRYRIGLVLFLLPILMGWLLPYVDYLLPFYVEYRIVFNLLGDLMMISGVFVLGGDFWDKLRALFIHNAKVNLQD